MGGITEATTPAWLAFGAVLCVGGSWVVAKGGKDMEEVEAAAKRAAGLGERGLT